MGCVSSNLLNNEDELTQLGSSALSHHIVSLTSTTYGLLNLDPPTPQSSATATTPPPPARFTLGSIFPSPLCEPKSLWSEPRSLPETINSWELMSGLDTDSFRFSPIIKKDLAYLPNKENSNPNFLKPFKDSSFANTPPPPPPPLKENAHSLERFEKLCPPNGDDKVVIYTTSLRGIRETFDACSVVRAAIGGFGVLICERDVSMDRGFREELRELMRGKEPKATLPPRVFIKGRYIGSVEEVMRIAEEGLMGELLQGLPKKRAGDMCDGCGDVRFLPCFSCNGSSKLVMLVKDEEEEKEPGLKQRRTVVVRCPDCNENGLVLCPICA
ncbi:uncharacterized protein At5g39865 [Ricinus communis]|uniref:Electron transporter, putative n=1 Tax=Ricinus communis TaxID=3988 RepID=B9RYV4_RICCO|nr:uncharacterized protein At5g39865 [Ricinus communis]EEF43456.1 electron transporter, putative [Ricinus communis]|eukprot:XP_002518923.1 uncharacterized protein At5g39865 [Ricinus communis]